MFNIGNCVIVRLDRRLCKFIYNLLHNDNLVVKQITEYKMLQIENNNLHISSLFRYSQNINV